MPLQAPCILILANKDMAATSVWLGASNKETLATSGFLTPIGIIAYSLPIKLKWFKAPEAMLALEGH